MKIFSAQQIRAWDAFSMQNEPISSTDLMERAAAACYRWILGNLDNSKPFFIFCGKGNNGGDGLALARMLTERKLPVTVFILETSKEASDDFHKNLKRLRGIHSDIHYIHEETTIPFIPSDIIVIDALFGSGLNRPLDGLAAALVNKINSSGADIIAIDIPSGLFADKNSAGSSIIKAHSTLSFQLPKLAFFMPGNEAYVGDFFVLDIGLHPDFELNEASSIHLLLKSDITQRLKARKKFAHKGNFGHALIMAGSYGKMGAAILNSHACLRTGAGLVTACIPSCGYEIIQTALPEVMCITDEDDRVITRFPAVENFDAIAVGPGIGTDEKTAQALANFLGQQRGNLNSKLVIDADGLNILSQNKPLLQQLPSGTILTPHPKEFERLFGKTNDDFERLELQKKMSVQYNCVILLKGHYSKVTTPDAEVYINSTGNAGMATAGSGDVLTGIICSLLAQGFSPADAAITGMYLHGYAGDIAAKKLSQPAMIASDIIHQLPDTFLQLQ